MSSSYFIIFQFLLYSLYLPSFSSTLSLISLIQLSKYGVILSWAVVGQGGHGHVNEKSNQDIIKVRLYRYFIPLKNRGRSWSKSFNSPLSRPKKRFRVRVWRKEVYACSQPILSNPANFLNLKNNGLKCLSLDKNSM